MSDNTQAAAATPDTDTPPAADVTPDTPPEAGDNPAASGQPEAPADAVPESYTFTMPEGVALDTGLADSMSPLFREAGLSQAQAQKLVDAYAAHVAKLQEGGKAAFDSAYAERLSAERAAQSESWLAATKADTEIGGAKFEQVKARVIEAIGQVATPEAKQAFNELGWGNHPELIRLVHRLIDYQPQDRGERGSAGSSQQTDSASVLYPNESTR